MIDMRDEEEDVDSLSPHSQTRHERLHNQYNKVKEEDDQWQDVSHGQMMASCKNTAVCLWKKKLYTLFAYNVI